MANTLQKMFRIVTMTFSVMIVALILASPAKAQVSPTLSVQFSPQPNVVPGNTATLTTTITNPDPDSSLIDAALNMTVNTSSQYKPVLVSADSGYSCTITTSLYTASKVACTGGIINPGSSAVMVFSIKTPYLAGNTSIYYSAQGIANPYSVTASDSVLIAPYYAPDLLVSGSVNPKYTLVGSAVNYSVNVSNNGYIGSVATTLLATLPDGSVQSFDVPALAVNTSTSFALPYIPTSAGNQVATFVVDPTSAQTDGYRGNNTISLSFTAYADLPDLTISQTQPLTALVNTLYQKTVTVQNVGTLSANNIEVRDLFFISDTKSIAADHGFVCARTTYRVGRTARYLPNGFACSGGNLNPGETGTITATILAPLYSTSVSNTLAVDGSNKVIESNETNNSAGGSISVQ